MDSNTRRSHSEDTSPASSVTDDEKHAFDDLPDPLARRAGDPSNADKAILILLQYLSLLRTHLSFLSTFATSDRFIAVAAFLLPSWIGYKIFPDVAKSPGQIAGKMHPTAWLDGLRGIAAWAVFNYHMGLDVFINMAAGFGWSGQNMYLIKLPIIKLTYAGDAAVAIFFVISGFALSIRPVKLMNASPRDDASILQALSSAAFRRPIRLYLPSWIATWICFTLFQWGLFETVRWMTLEEPHRILTGFPPKLGYPFDTYWEGLYDFARECVLMFDLFHESPQARRLEGNHFNAPLWTIPMEFRASLLLYLTQLAVSRLHSTVRMSIVFCLTLIAVWGDRFEMVLFWGGFWLAELDYHLQRRPSVARTPPQTTALWSAFGVGLYLLSYPEWEGHNTPGFRMLSRLVPSCFTLTERFWPGVGALLVVFTVSRLEALQSALKMPLVRYMGIVSYALYVLHGMMIVYLGFALLYLTYLIFGRESTLALGVGFGIAWLGTLFASYWVADVFWRAVDIPSVTLGKTLENWCMGPAAHRAEQRQSKAGPILGGQHVQVRS